MLSGRCDRNCGQWKGQSVLVAAAVSVVRFSLSLCAMADTTTLLPAISWFGGGVGGESAGCSRFDIATAYYCF